MDAISILQFISQTASRIKETGDTVEINQKQIQRLEERVDAIVSVVRIMKDTDTRRVELNKSLVNFRNCLEQCCEFVTQFKDKASWYSKVFKSLNFKENFQELNQQLSQCATDLNLGINLKNVFDPKQDESDQQEDLNVIQSKVNEIASMMARQQEEQFHHFKDIKEHINDRISSFKHHLNMNIIRANDPVKAKKIAEEQQTFLQIPYHDLLQEEEIGHGAFADVYRGRWLSHDDEVAIKIIRVQNVGEQIKNDFMKEISTMFQIHYDHILNIFGACIEPNKYALVAEYMSLGSLHDVLKQHAIQLTWPDRWSIAQQMTKGINYLHKCPKPIIHRDIKSLNVLMTRKDLGFLVKVGDFGLAKIRHETSRQSTQIDSVGTLAWKAPELLRMGKHTEASDVYALGIVLWELATGCEPYEDSDASTIMEFVRRGDRLEIPEDIPSSFAEMILGAWAQNAKERPTCQELLRLISKGAESVTAELVVEPVPPTSQPPSQPISQSTPPLSKPPSQLSSQPTFTPPSEPPLQPSSQPPSQPTFTPPSQPPSQPTLQPPSQPIRTDNSATIVVQSFYDSGFLSPIAINSKWKQNAITIVGSSFWKRLSKLTYPSGIYVDDNDRCIYIVDCGNDRIVQWKYNAKTGQIAAGGNGEGNRMDQLNYPTDVVLDKKTDSLIIGDRNNRRVVRWSRQNGTNGETIISQIDCFGLAMGNNGDLYVSDRNQHVVIRWKIGDTNGTIVAGGNGNGNHLNQLNYPTYLCVGQDDSVYVSDTDNHRVVKWMKGAKEGILVAGGQGKGNSWAQLSFPAGVLVDHLNNVYVADWDNHRIMCWLEGSNEGQIIVGGNGEGEQPNQLHGPKGISFDREDNLYVVDCGNHRVQKFEINFN